MKNLLWLLLLLIYCSTYAQTGDRVAYYYRGKKVSFPVNNGRLVMQFRGGENPDTRRMQLAALLKVPGSAITPLAGARQASAKLPAGLGSAKMKMLLSSLRSQGYLQFVHPCITSTYGKDVSYGDELVVKLKTSTTKLVFDNLLKQAGSSIVKTYAFAPGIFIISAGAANGYDALAVANRFFETGLFEYAQPDFTLLDALFTDPNDPLFGYQWAQTNTGSAIQYSGSPATDMKVQQAWGITTGAGITIAVLDEGVDTGHADLKANLVQGFNCLTGTANLGDGRPLGPARGHGTCCAGIIAALANNSTGIAGVAPGSKIIPINLAAANGNFTSESNIAAGFDYAWQHGADVISNSWGGGTPSSVLDDAILRAVTLGRGGKGSVVLFATGNNNAGLSYPATNENVISVGGVNMCGRRKSPASAACDGEGWGASFGTGLDVVAPCVKIATTDISGSGGYNTAAGSAGDYFLRFNGTSSATPNTAGVVALVLAANNNLTATELRNVLESTCDKLPSYNYAMVPGQPNGSWNNETGHGLVNAFTAIQTALSGGYCNVKVQAKGPARFCTGGSVGISVINPIAGTVYQWRKDGINLSTGTMITATTAGSYEVVATAVNGCVAVSAPVAVTVPDNTQPLLANAGIDTFICAGQSVKLGGVAPAVNGAPWLAEKRAFGMDWQSNSFIKFSLNDPLHLDTIARNIVSNADYTAQAFFTGGDFTPYGYYAITAKTNRLIKFDTATGAQQLIGIAAAPAGFVWCGMSWDASTKTLYALASSAAASRLCVINPLTAAVVQTIPVAVGLTEWLSVSNGGQLYIMSDNNYVYKVDKQTGAAVAFPNHVGADVLFEQDADFDPLTDSLYMTVLMQSQTFVSDLRTLNTTTGVSTVIGSLGSLSEIDATGIAGAGYQYNWLPATGLSSATVSVPVATPLTTTTYTLSVTDMCGNIATSQVTVHVSAKPLAAITAARDSICVGESVRLITESNTNYVYQWYRNGTAIAGGTDSFYLATNGGVYAVRIVNGACDSLSLPFTVKTCQLRLNNSTPASLCATWFYDSGGPSGNYADGQSFSKTITASTPGSLPQLTLTDFNTEPGNDVVTVFDGPNTSSPVLAVLSGTPVLPLAFTGTSGALTIQFISNGTVNSSGWAGSLGCYQPTVYRSRASGNASATSTWQMKWAGNFIDAFTIPHVYDDSIIVQPGHTVSIDEVVQLDQLLVKGGATLNINAPLTLNNGAGIDLQSDGTVVLGAAGNISGTGTILVNGDFNNAASVNSRVNVPVTIGGSMPQTIMAGANFSGLYITNPAVNIGLAAGIAIDSVTINNGTGMVTISSVSGPAMFTINDSLYLQHGKIRATDNAVLNMAASAVVRGGNDSSFAQGPVRCNTNVAGLSTLFFPVGTALYTPVRLQVTHASAGASAYQAEAFNAAPASRSLPASINAVSTTGFVRISNMGSQPVTSSAVTLRYVAADLVTDLAALRIAKDDGGSAWLDMGGTDTVAGAGTMTTTVDINTWGDFVLANATGGTNAFIVRWLQADANLAGKQIQLSWKIGNEVNISKYTVEWSADGVSFTDLTTVQATAGFAAEKNYESADRLPQKGTNYYRIRQTAKDGRGTYSRIMQVSISVTNDYIVWPNPAVSTVHVQNRQAMTRLQCFNSNGQLVYDVRPGSTQHSIPVRRWSAGVYTLRIAGGSANVLTRFVKQ